VSVRAALAALELAGIHYRRDARQALRIGEEDLAALLYLAHHGGVTQGRLADATSLSRSGTGALVQRLQERGYVARATDATDRRLRLISLTPAGRARLDEAYAGFEAALERALSGRGRDELETLATTLAEIAATTTAPAGNARPLAPPADAGERIWSRWA
jgi:DNA-binding MarR family transcriptional regulator